MRMMKTATVSGLTFEEGCEMYIGYCKQRNLREGTVNHYRQSYTQLFKYFDRNMPVHEFDAELCLFIAKKLLKYDIL